MANLGGIVDFLLMLSIGGLVGLVIALHLKLRRFSEEAEKVPALADDLTRAITTSRDTMQALAKSAKTDGARLEELLSRAESSRQDLIYVLDRAEQVLKQFDTRLADQPVPRLDRTQNTATASTAPSSPAFSEPSQTPQQESSKSQPTPQDQSQAQPQTQAHSKPQETESKAAIMPGRYQSRLGVDQNGSPTPYRPASYQSGAAAYGANAQNYERAQETSHNQTDNTTTTDAEGELRRALENAI